MADMVEEAEMAQIMTATMTATDLLEIIPCVHRRTAVMITSRSARRATTKIWMVDMADMVEEAEMAQIMTATMTATDLLEIILCVHRRTAVMMASRSARRATTKAAFLQIILCVHRRSAVMITSRSARRATTKTATATTKTEMVKMTGTTTTKTEMVNDSNDNDDG